jgi:hypothetical protein
MSQITLEDIKIGVKNILELTDNQREGFEIFLLKHCIKYEHSWDELYFNCSICGEEASIGLTCSLTKDLLENLAKFPIIQPICYKCERITRYHHKHY